MADDALMQSLERECADLLERGRTGRANEGRRILHTLQNALAEYQTALQEAIRRQSRAQAPNAGPLESVAFSLVKAVLHEWRLMVNDSRARAKRFVETFGYD